MLLTRSKTAHAPLAAIVTAFSTYLIGLCIHASRRSWWRLTPIQTGQIAHLTTVTDYGAGTQGPTKIGQTGGNGSSAEIPPIERGARHRAMLLKSKVPARATIYFAHNSCYPLACRDRASCRRCGCYIDGHLSGVATFVRRGCSEARIQNRTR